MKTVYENTVKSLGACVDDFQDEAMFILFGDNAPDTLKDYCYCIDVNPILAEIEAGQKAVIDGEEYKITAVGDMVMRNLGNLGHVTFSFDGATEPELPGTIYLEKKPMPKLKVGSKISIVA